MTGDEIVRKAERVNADMVDLLASLPLLVTELQDAINCERWTAAHVFLSALRDAGNMADEAMHLLHLAGRIERLDQC